MASVKIGCPTGMLVAGISDIRRSGGRLLTQHTGLLMDAEAVVPLSSGLVSSTGASNLGCMMAVSALLIEHAGPAPNLAIAERNNERSLTESA